MTSGVAEERKPFDDTLRLPLPRLTESSFSEADYTISALIDERLYRACKTRIAFTFRYGGVSRAPFDSLNLMHKTGDSEAAIEENRRRVCGVFGALDFYDRLIVLNQVHGIDVIDAAEIVGSRNTAPVEADGIVCEACKIPVLLFSADCAVITLVAPSGAFCIVHAGWRGALESIAGIGLDALIRASGFACDQINCYIGPHIGACCYEVDSDLLKEFTTKYGAVCDAGENHLDLSAAIRASLLQAGACKERIIDAQLCTSCRTDILFSYRAEAGATGRHGAFAFREEMRWKRL